MASARFVIHRRGSNPFIERHKNLPAANGAEFRPWPVGTDSGRRVIHSIEQRDWQTRRAAEVTQYLESKFNVASIGRRLGAAAAALVVAHTAVIRFSATEILSGRRVNAPR